MKQPKHDFEGIRSRNTLPILLCANTKTSMLVKLLHTVISLEELNRSEKTFGYKKSNLYNRAGWHLGEDANIL